MSTSNRFRLKSTFACLAGRLARASLMLALTAASHPGIAAAGSITTAQSGVNADSSQSSAQFIRHFRSLESLSGQKDIWLKGDDSSYRVVIPITHRVRIRHAQLHLEYVNSPSLIEPRSQISVRLNGHVIAAGRLLATENSGQMDIEIEGRLFKPGYNELQIAAAQHYTMQCEDGWSPELWTDIKADASFLGLDYDEVPVDASLRNLPELIDPKIWDRYNIALLAPASARMGAAEKEIGGIIAQAVGLKTKFLPVHVSFARFDGASLPDADRDAIIFGYDADLMGTPWQPAQDSGIRIMPRPDNPKRFLVIISGKDTAALRQAATAFASMSHVLTDMQTTAIHHAEDATQGSKILRDNASYRFDALGFSTQQVQGLRNKRSLEFWVAPDAFSRAPLNIKLGLHLSYGAGMREDSTLDISLNQHFAKAIALANRNGEVFENYEITLPLSLLKPGRNIIEFTARMNPLMTGDCKAVFTDNLLLTLYGDSQLSMPAVDHFVRMPDLELLARTGFPFAYNAAQPDNTAMLVLASDTPQALAAAWTLESKLAQIKGAPFELRFTDKGKTPNSAQIIVIGGLDDIASSWWQQAPLSVATDGRARYPQTREATIEAGQRGFFAQVAERLFGHARPIPNLRLSEIRQSLQLGRVSLFSQFGDAGQTVTLLTTKDASKLDKTAFSLVDFDTWGQLQGDTFTWSPDSHTMGPLALQLADGYELSSLAPWARAAYAIADRPLLMALLLGGIFVIILLLLRKLLALYRVRHHPEA